MRTLLAIVLALTAVQSGIAAPPQSERSRYSFTVEIEGRSLGAFREVTGLSVETELVEYRDGTTKTTWYLPGNTKYSTIKLTRAFNGDGALWDWYTTSAHGGHEARVGGTITIYDRSGNPVAQYHLINAWPRKVEGPTLNAGSNDVPVETIEIAHTGLILERPGSMR